MTHKPPPDLARFSALLAAQRRQRLAVCLRGATALSPSLSLLAAMLASLATGVFSRAAFPEAVLAPGRRWSLASGATADPAQCGEATPHAQRSAAGIAAARTPPTVSRTAPLAATPHAQRSPADVGGGGAEAGPTGAQREAAAIPHSLRQPPAIAVAQAGLAGAGAARVAATPHAQRSATRDRPAAAKSPPAGPLPETVAIPYVQRQQPEGELINANPRPAPSPGLGPFRGPSAQGEREYSLARQHPMPSGGRGCLKNGAAGGDYLAAPRCGARTRAAGSCRQPAMPNGRCRLHGGKSTGARTEAGRERLRSIHTRHGGYGRDLLAWFRRMDAFIAETKQVMAESRRTRAVAAAVRPAAGDRT